MQQRKTCGSTYRLKDVVNDDGGQVKQHAGDALGVRVELFASRHQRVENNRRIRLVGVLECHGGLRSGVWRICRSELRIVDVVPRTIGASILESRVESRVRRVIQGAPQLGEKAVRQLFSFLGIRGQLG